MIKISLWLFVLFAITSCGDKKPPSYVLKPDKMQAVMWDIIKAEAFTSGFIINDTTTNAVEEYLKLQQQVFIIHQTTPDVFYKSYDYYKSNTPVFKVILDSMIAQAERDNNNRTKTLIAQ